MPQRALARDRPEQGPRFTSGVVRPDPRWRGDANKALMVAPCQLLSTSGETPARDLPAEQNGGEPNSRPPGFARSSSRRRTQNRRMAFAGNSPLLQTDPPLLRGGRTSTVVLPAVFNFRVKRSTQRDDRRKRRHIHGGDPTVA